MIYQLGGSTGGGASALNELTDVTLTAEEQYQSLIYDGTEWVNTHASVVTYVRNDEATTMNVGDVVYLSGATGDHANVKFADNSSDATSSKTVGLVAGASIDASQNGVIVTRGYVSGIDLSVGYTPGDVLWLGTTGTFTNVKPATPEHLVFVGVAVRCTNNGIVYVATQNGYELDELHDVAISSPAAGDLLSWNGTSWVNQNAYVLWENVDWETLISGAGAPTAAVGGDGWYYLDTTPGSEALYGPATFNPALLPTGVWDWGSPLANFTFSATGPSDEAGDWYVWDENGDGSVYTLFQKKTAINYGDMLFWSGTKWEARSQKFAANDVYVDLTNIDPTYGVDNVRVALANLYTNKADKFVTFNDQTGTTYTLVGDDYGKMVTLDNASAITVTVPADTFVPGDVVGLLQKGAGQVTVAGDVGVTVNSVATLALSAQWATASLLCVANNEFVLTGNLA